MPAARYAVAIAAAFFLQDQLEVAKDDVAHQVFLATLGQSTLVVLTSVAGGRLSDRTGRRKTFVLTTAALYGASLLVVAGPPTVGVFLIGMTLSGLGFGIYLAVDLALVADVLPDPDTVSKDLGCSTSKARCRSSCPRPSLPRYSHLVAAATACCTPRGGWVRDRQWRRHPAGQGRPVTGLGSSWSSSASRTAARRLFTPSLP